MSTHPPNHKQTTGRCRTLSSLLQSVDRVCLLKLELEFLSLSLSLPPHTIIVLVMKQVTSTRTYRQHPCNACPK